MGIQVDEGPFDKQKQVNKWIGIIAPHHMAGHMTQ